ncbi:MAG TPA: thioredoxin family protein [Gemmatimonadaceae bacterium]|nr:thioredoxin family protein [Gemmatimonadaceae bacterium]
MIALAALAVAGTVCLTSPTSRAGLPPSGSRLPFGIASRAAADTLHQRLFDSGQTFADFVAGARNRKEQWERHFATAVVPDELVTRVTQAGGPWKLLVVTLDGCSDSVNSVPYIAAMLAKTPNVEVRLVTSSVGRAIMEAHRTPDGRAATPTLVLLDSTYAERGCWIERPEALRTFMQEHKARSGDSGLFDAKMKWYEEEKGSQSIVEIVEMIEAAARNELRCS